MAYCKLSRFTVCRASVLGDASTKFSYLSPPFWLRLFSVVEAETSNLRLGRIAIRLKKQLLRLHFANTRAELSNGTTLPTRIIRASANPAPTPVRSSPGASSRTSRSAKPSTSVCMRSLTPRGPPPSPPTATRRAPRPPPSSPPGAATGHPDVPSQGRLAAASATNSCSPSHA